MKLSSPIGISVVCPVFNSADCIRETINSVFSQNSLPNEFIVVDDGSTDDTIEIVKALFETSPPDIKCRLIASSHAGPGAARNQGVCQTRFDWVAFIDSDDIWYEDKIKEVRALIRTHPEYNFVCANEHHRLLNGKVISLDAVLYINTNKSIPQQLYFRNYFSTSAVVIQKSLLSVYGGFDENLNSAQDYELWLKLSPFLIVGTIPKCLGMYVERIGSITSSTAILRKFANEKIIKVRYRRFVSPYVYVCTMVLFHIRWILLAIRIWLRRLKVN